MAMAFLAQVRRTRLEQVCDDRAMRVVADAAVFGNRLMVMNKGAAFFHVTGIASLVHSASDHLFGIVAMHVVT